MKNSNKYYLRTFMIAFIGNVLFSNTYAQTPPGWKSLFDGKTLNGWKQATGKAGYTVEKGQIVGTTVMDSPNSFLVTQKEYGDFILELDTKVDNATSNSGIQTRSHFDPHGNNEAGKVYGRQVEIDPSDRRWT